MKVSEMRMLEIVNFSDGRKIGPIKDVEIDPITGCVKALIIGSEGKVFGMFGRNEDYVIPWDQVKKVGLDIILVEINKSYIELQQPCGSQV